MMNAVTRTAGSSPKPLISVAIYLRGTDLDPKVVSGILGIEPSRAQKRGQLKPGSRKFVAKIGTWVLKIASDSRSVESMIDELLQKVGNPTIPMDRIENVEDSHL